MYCKMKSKEFCDTYVVTGARKLAVFLHRYKFNFES